LYWLFDLLFLYFFTLMSHLVFYTRQSISSVMSSVLIDPLICIFKETVSLIGGHCVVYTTRLFVMFYDLLFIDHRSLGTGWRRPDPDRRARRSLGHARPRSIQSEAAAARGDAPERVRGRTQRDRGVRFFSPGTGKESSVCPLRAVRLTDNCSRYREARSVTRTSRARALL